MITRNSRPYRSRKICEEMSDWQNYFKNLPINLVGVGVTAFNRCLPAFFVPDYRIVCAKDSLDLPQIAKKCEVIAAARDFSKGPERLNSLAILKHPDVQRYLHRLVGKVGVFLYKSTERVEKVCAENGWQVVGNLAAVRDPFENKQVFREALLKLGLRPIDGEIVNLASFDEAMFVKMQQKYGPELVLKLPEIVKGGGVGLSFVKNQADLKKFWQKVAWLRKKHDLKNLIIEKKLDALSPSISGCATRFGVLTGVVQTQIVDVPEVIEISRGAGMFVGHDWSYRPYSEKVQEQAEMICRCFGEYLYQKGYRGVFGLDLLVEKNTDLVYACECNPRFTGAFPVYSMMQLAQREIPFEAFHLLELLNLDYQMEIEVVQEKYRQTKQGSQIILHNLTPDWLEVGSELSAGVYHFNNGNLEFLRPGFSFLDLQQKDEFVLTDGIPKKGALIKPYLRILKIIFGQSILAADGKKINQRSKEIISQVYHQLGFQPKS